MNNYLQNIVIQVINLKHLILFSTYLHYNHTKVLEETRLNLEITYKSYKRYIKYVQPNSRLSGLTLGIVVKLVRVTSWLVRVESFNTQNEATRMLTRFLYDSVKINKLWLDSYRVKSSRDSDESYDQLVNWSISVMKIGASVLYNRMSHMTNLVNRTSHMTNLVNWSFSFVHFEFLAPISPLNKSKPFLTYFFLFFILILFILYSYWS